MKKLLAGITNILNSRRFFWCVLLFFILESAWIAASALYPQAFDEDFHFGLIRVYSHYWLPFLSSQPAHANAYSAVPRDPSYLYHYLMSFPYRVVATVIHGQTAQVIVMRFCNIALASGGLILFQRVLRHAGMSRVLTNLSLLIFVLIPIAPQLAGQVNYDNLVFLCTAWACWLAMRLTDEIRAGDVSIRTVLTLATVGIFGTQVKYEFLPIFVGLVLFLLYTAWRQFGRDWRRLVSQLGQSWHQQQRGVRIVLILALAISLGLFAQRDGYNLVKYHTFTPDCSRILSVQACSAYGPWNANHQRHLAILAQHGNIHFNNPIIYAGQWFYWLWYRLFFAINGPPGYKNYLPLPLPAAAAVLIAAAGVVAVIIAIRRHIFQKSPYYALFASVIIVYSLALWIEGLLQYHYTHVLVLMNGRYLLPILLPAAFIIGSAFRAIWRHRPTLKQATAALAILCFLQGGGVFTFILRSDPSWDWPHSAATKANNAARTVLRPLIIPGKKK